MIGHPNNRNHHGSMVVVVVVIVRFWCFWCFIIIHGRSIYGGNVWSKSMNDMGLGDAGIERTRRERMKCVYVCSPERKRETVLLCGTE